MRSQSVIRLLQFGGRKAAPKVIRETVVPDPDYRIPLVLLGMHLFLFFSMTVPHLLQILGRAKSVYLSDKFFRNHFASHIDCEYMCLVWWIEQERLEHWCTVTICSLRRQLGFWAYSSWFRCWPAPWCTRFVTNPDSFFDGYVCWLCEPLHWL